MYVIAVLWTGFFVINFNVVMMVPLLPFVERDIGLSPSQSGMVLAAFPIVALASNLALGPLIDRYGRKRFIVAGAVGCAAILAATAAARSATTITAGRAATGLFMPMIGASVFAAIADHVPAGRRAFVAGYITSAAPVAFLLSMSTGVLLGGLVTWQVPLVLLAAICLGLAALASALPPTGRELLSDTPISMGAYRQRLSWLSSDAETRPLLVSYFGWSLAMYIFLGLYPSWLVQHGLARQGPGAIGFVLFLGEVGGLLGAFWSGKLSACFRHPLMPCAIASFGLALCVAIVPFGAELPVFQAVAYGIFAFGRDLMLALMLGGTMRLAPAAQRGSLNAALNTVYQTGATAGGLTGAWLYGICPNLEGNAAVSSIAFAACALMLWNASRTRLSDRHALPVDQSAAPRLAVGSSPTTGPFAGGGH